MSIDHSSATLFCNLNSHSSDIPFRKSCERVLQRTKQFESHNLEQILAFDNPGKPFIDDHQHVYIWYLAIGSMINPISLHLRDITPLMSYPAKCFDHRLVFRDRSGMADIDFCEGEEFDGVVHLVPIEQMNRLDQVEHMYTKIIVPITDYQERSHLVYVYKMTPNGQQERPIGIPSERYLDIIIKGCEYFGVRSSYINRLKNKQTVIPRKSADTYQTIADVPDNVFYTYEDLAKHDGKDPTVPLWISVNGKVLEYSGLPSVDHPDYENQKRFYDFVLSYFGGREVVCAISRAWYEPMFKIPLNNDDICDEHRALAEDMCVSWGLNCGGDNNASYWKPIGRICQIKKS
ncbi:unnamed protein product [Adineta ricciae]|uniref:Uncharacterized protein n=1 Tax=Adineta ricciae TaxID=249248 RepID=A0A814Y626_ADIRI|nr:unnamed protein product [Adineta ricciae]CAF1225857.1 unnamed protein product [Adineta ricciae]